ncbi:carbonyl reductase [NADPH] 1-like [Galleria mellonella]|uniref:Carbonyl reductase [NADPH] 1-like n=1 Tax=Galleria mellonella TaxID=7137 RepID=A0A6J1WIY0_GALME|nr:carbonyl reductase [NADPH] 1-like [Galleria mellonella]
MSNKVAVVTGSNKGIGFGIVKGLCQKFDGVVYLTCRDVAKGKAAIAKLNKLGLHPEYHQLDIGDRDSVIRFRDHIKDTRGGIDILINNAGVAPKFTDSYDAHKEVIDINYGGILTIEELLFPLLRDNARVLNISSDCGHLSNVKNEYWRNRLCNKALTRNDIDEFVQWYLDAVRNGTFKRSDIADYGSVASYRVSKVAISALTMIQQKDLASRNISVNSMHPGLVSTDMTARIGFFTPDQAAETPIYLVLEAPPSLRGAYIWFDRRVIDWFDYNTDYYFKYASVPRQFVKNIITSKWLFILIVAYLACYYLYE